ncbi:hypothetical protein GZ77_16940 [Endozoicomonas montiporae]|uniref:Uncharacterized protein n=2 Tax=Endozoicomonas montiporae TaxID=1027273 RepID=A0A081N658_9GAMM|nr:hypothetical protein [Endozoicomonas montiporae]AMO57146.1 hypothetical protein EZMO1_3140 [Endozoicomonas montiporae CL-33]KEQ13931.1 hypothetical protein GZ77_16940 [Endozoicomonas montiporae]
MKPEQKLLYRHLKAAGLKPVLFQGKSSSEGNAFVAISFDLAPGIEAECITRKPARNLISTTLMVTIDLEESEELNTFALATGQLIAPLILCQTRHQMAVRLQIQSETRNHLKLINEGIIQLRFTAGALLNPAIHLSQQTISLTEAIQSAVAQLQSRVSA